MKPLNARGPGKAAASVASWVAICALVAFLGLAGLAAASHGGVDQITDPAGDAVASAELAGLPDDPMLRENLTANQTLADITHAWIQYETADHFVLLIQVDDIPDGWGLPEQPPEHEIWSMNKSVVRHVASFNVSGADYRAVAVMHSAFDGSIVAAYHLVDAEGNQTGVSGGFDTTQDRIWLMLPKAPLGVTDDSVLTKFFVYSMVDNVTVDYAPDAEYLVDAGEDPALPGLPDDPVGEVGGIVEDPPDAETLLAMIAVPENVEPQYGWDYPFGQYARPSSGGGGSGGGAAVTSALKITAAELQGTVAPGAVHSYQLTIHNEGDAADAIRLSLNNAPAGWAHELSADAKGELQLDAGASRDVSLLVSVHEDAEKRSFRSVVSYASSGGQSGSVSILNLLGEASADPDQGSSGDGQADDGGDSPGLVVPVLLPSLLAVAWYARRRRNH